MHLMSFDLRLELHVVDLQRAARAHGDSLAIR